MEEGPFGTVKFLHDPSGRFRADELQQSAFIQLDNMVVDVAGCLMQLLGYLFGGQRFIRERMHNFDPQCAFQQFVLLLSYG
ncbi:hypothetical protein D3C79_976960 [compost metagenome]